MAYALLPHPFRKRPAAPVAITAPAIPASPWRALPWLLAAMLLLLAATGLHAQVAINSNAALPNVGGGHSILDISSPNLGILAPRMTSAQRVNLGSNAVDGLLVYQTDSLGLSPRGYWYWDAGTAIIGWKHIAWGGEIWKLGGNAGTSSANFLGSVNNMPLVFRINNAERGRISANGELQLYYLTPIPTPNELVEVTGGIKLAGGSVGNNEGTIRYTPGAAGAPGKFEGYVVNTAGANINGWKQIDNNFSERKIQETPVPGSSCLMPSSLTNPDGAPRTWPIPGPTSAFTTLSGPQSPYWGVWEDSRRQWLFRQIDLAATGMCPNTRIDAIAFNVVSAYNTSKLLHFLRFALKNTTATTINIFDPALSNDALTFATPAPPEIPGPPPKYAPAHNTGYSVQTGWNVHPYGEGFGGGTSTFFWGNGGIIVDAAVDNQNWNGTRQGDVAGYNSGYASMVSVYCDACGFPTGGHSNCKWSSAVVAPFYFPPTTPRNGVQGTNGNFEGWGWVGGWDLTQGTNVELCDGGGESWNPAGSFSTSTLLPRVAFLCKYTGTGAAYNVGNYMVAENGVMIGTATWANSTAPNVFRGPGTISAQKSVWSGASLLSDYVFDLYYDGKSKPEDAEGAGQYVRTPLKDLPNFVERERHLPTIDGRNAWEKAGTFSVDKLGNQLWVTVEDQSLYIQELNARMDALQKFLVEKKLKELQKK